MAIRKFTIKIDGKVYEAEVEETGGAAPAAQAAAAPKMAASPQPVMTVGSGNAISAPMPGKIISVKVTKGQQVNVGDVVLILEAMKMEQEIKSTISGTVSDILVSDGDTVKKEQPLISIG